MTWLKISLYKRVEILYRFEQLQVERIASGVVPNKKAQFRTHASANFVYHAYYSFPLPLIM